MYIHSTYLINEIRKVQTGFMKRFSPVANITTEQLNFPG